MDWYRSLPPAQAQVPCGGGTHTLRWDAGRLEFPGHPDAEAERVLAALGGDKARCVEAAEIWARHSDDLDVLASGPRSRADLLTTNWDDAEQHRSTFFGLPPSLASSGRSRPGAPMGPAGPGAPSGPSSGGSSAPGPSSPGPASGPGPGTGPGSGLGSRPGSAGPGPGGPGAGPIFPTVGGPGRIRKLGGHVSEELLRRVQARIEVLQLLALGPAFQFRLAGTVTAAWAADSHAARRAARQPELTAALTGRAAPAIAEWLGITPDAVMVTPLEPPPPTPQSPAPGSPHPPASPPPGPPASASASWGSLDILGTGTNRLVRASLPVGWLASVWACGLALVSDHLVVAVEEAGWPRARVLALREPGAPLVVLDVMGTDDGAIPHWQAAGAS